jgi:TonB family protein
MKVYITLLLIVTFFQGISHAQVNKPAEPISSKKLTKDFIEAAIIYPEEDLINRNEGRVKLQFKVNTEGYVSHFKTIIPQTSAMNKEAVRLVSKILWNPAIVNGRAIDSEQTFEILFSLKHYNRIIKIRGYDRIEQNFQKIDSSGKIYNFGELDEKPIPLIDNNYKTLSHYIQENLQYPDAAFAAGINGTVKLDFVIEEDGIVSNLRVDQSVGGGCDNEAIRILQSIRWKPGVINDYSVRSYASINVTFKISEYQQRAIPNRQATGL